MPSDDLTRDTIAAIATPAGRGGIGIVRVSGPGVPRVAAAVLGRLPQPRLAMFGSFRDRQGETIDEGLALYFPAPHSYTGEAVLELQGHGGPVVLQALLSACVDAGARVAEPGEFTRRAFLEGKLDLAQAEAVADLIDAASREAACSALRSLSGEFSAAIGALQARLVELRAVTEAMLDFPEEEVDVLQREDAAARLAQARRALAELRTRDALREPLLIEGVPIIMVDTAGLRVSRGEIERLGIQRTRQELERADLVIAVFEANRGPDALQDLPAASSRIDVYNKVDLAPGFAPPGDALAVSAKTGAGLEALRQRILEAAGWTTGGEPVFLARERHLRALERAAAHLAAAEGETARWEFFAEELRLAHAALGSITGEFSADDLLGEIFKRFCIGK